MVCVAYVRFKFVTKHNWFGFELIASRFDFFFFVIVFEPHIVQLSICYCICSNAQPLIKNKTFVRNDIIISNCEWILCLYCEWLKCTLSSVVFFVGDDWPRDNHFEKARGEVHVNKETNEQTRLRVCVRAGLRVCWSHWHKAEIISTELWLLVSNNVCAVDFLLATSQAFVDHWAGNRYHRKTCHWSLWIHDISQ